MFDNLSERTQLEQAAQSGARWFFWIAALTIITSVIALTGSSWHFIISLGVTQIFDGLAAATSEQGGSLVKVIAFTLDAIAAGVFALLGVLAQKRYSWSFMVGMTLFGLDSLLFLLGRDWIGIAFHAYVLYALYRGFSAAQKLSALDREASLMQPPDPPANFGTQPAS